MVHLSSLCTLVLPLFHKPLSLTQYCLEPVEEEEELKRGMSRRRVLVLLKPTSFYPSKRTDSVARSTNPQILAYLDSRRKVHDEAVNFCQEIFRRKSLDWKPLPRDDISKPIRNVDLVITIGGDGTLLHASHFIDDSIPVLGMNSDPTKVEEVEEFKDQFDASRSTGSLCAATIKNFEQVLDDILEGRKDPIELSRISISVNNQVLSQYALNDILMAHPCPAAVSRFSFRIKTDDHVCSPLVNSRSSGLRVSTAAGSTAAMLSAGGFKMPVSSEELQYMVREPILPQGVANSSSMHGLIKSGQSMLTTWNNKDGMIYIDGSYVSLSIQHGDSIEISSGAPRLKVFLPQSESKL